ncbi:Hypothetical protein in Cyanoglobin locus [Pseudoalteromonas luteoviolacea B = ATCC 29581]|nr:Hypothetical protein in Cyanoglobin locus [Pseudoalteromonas luteoviolacea B = ATCC 29581]
MKRFSRVLSVLFWLIIPWGAKAAEGKILATPGVSQIEGSAGGGIVPWAQLAGYASEDEWSLSGFCSRANLTDFRLDVCGVQANLFDHVEFSIARQQFDVPALNTQIEQQIIGAKWRVYGDIVYSTWPQVSVGWQHKSLKDGSVARLVGAETTSGNDFYVSASQLHLGAVAGLNWFWGVTARHTSANQLGLLGHGGEKSNTKWMVEASSAVFLSPYWAVGAEYRQKPDNLGLGETHWRDWFVAWFPNKSLSVTAAYLDLGSIAGAPNQTGWYLSFMGYY